MKRKLRRNNPFTYEAKGFIWEILKDSPSTMHLDFGARNGDLLTVLSKDGLLASGVGVDADKETVIEYQKRMPDNVKLHAVTPNSPLNFPDNFFDSISIVGVVEHVNDQKTLLSELARVTKVGGTIFVGVPGKHFLSFLDMGNFKFTFPKLHRYFFTFWRGKQSYHDRYVECKNGLFGDIEKEKMWHEHFSQGELQKLLANSGYDVIEKDGAGGVYRILLMCRFFFPGLLKIIPRWLLKLDAKLFSNAEIFVAAKKR
ncbi:MAG: class I SAM-dependent methyltransferase [Coxiellaceae bacterium]|nr:class I SAM-dependent methyltransferase [Coxiellaceae bacterium]